MVLREDVFRRDPNLSVTLDQKLNLTKDDQFLNLGVWDTVSGRFGSIEVPLDVHKPPKTLGVAAVSGVRVGSRKYRSVPSLN